MESLTRTALLLGLLAAYAAATLRPVLLDGAGRRFDALAPESRFVERAIGEHRFGDALPVALQLRHAHTGEPRPFGNTGIVIGFAVDPAGNRIELIQPRR